MSTTYKFEGWHGHDDNAGEGNLTHEEFQPKPWDEDDVDVRLKFCGICGSDVSALSGEWGPTADKPANVCGHELIGEVVKVGSQVANDLKVGDVVGIGAESDSCGECEWCKAGKENHCAAQTITFGAPYNRGNAKGYVAKGGFAKYWRGPSKFAIKVPEGLDLASAGPLFCGGVTVYAPLARYGAGKKAKKVGVIGVGGLGHFAILFAKAMGAEVTVLSRGNAKKEDAMKLGATHYIATEGDLKEALKPHAHSLDLVICTINPPDFPIADYLTLMRPEGHFVLVGIVKKPLEIPVFSLLGGAIAVTGSIIGSPAEIREMLQFAADHQVKPWVNMWKYENINEALKAFKKGDPRYRFVLEM